MIDLQYTDVDRKASSSRSPGRLLFSERTRKMAAVIGFSSGVLKSLSSMEMRLLLWDRGRADPSFFFAVMRVCAASEQTEWGQVSDPGG